MIQLRARKAPVAVIEAPKVATKVAPKAAPKTKKNVAVKKPASKVVPKATTKAAPKTKKSAAKPAIRVRVQRKPRVPAPAKVKVAGGIKKERKTATKTVLLKRAASILVKGRSKMTIEELVSAIARRRRQLRGIEKAKVTRANNRLAKQQQQQE